MAKIMRKILALCLTAALCAMQITVPTFAVGEEDQSVLSPQDTQPVESTPEQNVEVQVDLSQYSQVPEASDEQQVTEQEPVVNSDHDEAAGVYIDSTSTTTEWTGTEGDTQVTGSETSTEYTLTDDYTGQVLVEGGTLEGDESKETTETSEQSETTTEVTSTTEIISNTETIVDRDSFDSNEVTHGDVIEGQWSESISLKDEDHTTHEPELQDSKNISAGSADLPDGGVTIILKPVPDKSGVFYNSVNGEEVELEVPEGAEPIYEDGVLTGYKLITNEETETVEDDTVHSGTTTEPDYFADDIPNSVTAQTPDRDTFEHLLTDNSEITMEYDGNDPNKVIAYVITNTTENTTSGTGVQMPVRPADGTTTDETGNITTITSEDVTDETGAVVGYTYRQVITDRYGRLIQDSTTTLTNTDSGVSEAAAPQVTFTLPQKPTESDTTDDNGVRTLITVEDIYDESGNHVGYKQITIQTDSEGNELFMETHDTYGTETTVEQSVTAGSETCNASWIMTTTTTDSYRVTAEEQYYEDLQRVTSFFERTKTDRTTTNYELVTIDGKLYMIYEGNMTVREGSNHGNIDGLIPVTPNKKLFSYNSSQDLSSGGVNVVDDPNSSSPTGFRYTGKGISSNLKVNYGNGSTTLANQFRLKAPNGDEFYALCIDLDTSIQKGHLYDIDDIHEASYLADGTADKIRSIALNGYWGTESGIGSLQELKDLVEDYLDDETNMNRSQINDILNSLTHGQALSGTQAALWAYGDSGKNPVNTNNMINGNDVVDERNAKAVYDALIHAANDPDTQLENDEGVEFLDAEDIIGGAITINSQAYTDEGDIIENTYNTDLSFTLGIEPAKLFGDLIVTVKVGGQEIKKVRLAGNDDPLLSLGRIVKNDDGSYTIPDVELAAGVNVNLNLSGTQDLGTGVYIYTSLEGQFSNSQTLVTLASGSRSVDLDLNLSFQVEEPTVTAEHYEQYVDHKTVEDISYTRIDTKPRTEIKTDIDHTTKVHEKYETQMTCSTEVTIDTTTTEKTTENRSWFASWEKEVEQEPVPLNDDFEIPEDDPTEPTEPDKPEDDPAEPSEPDTNEPDEHEDDNTESSEPSKSRPVSHSDVPQTGDPTVLLAMLSLSSLGGLALLSRKKKED